MAKTLRDTFFAAHCIFIVSSDDVCIMYIDLVWCYKIVFELSNGDDFFSISVCHRLADTHTMSNYTRILIVLTLVCHSQRIVSVLNSLPNDVDFRSLSSFKRIISSVSFDKIFNSL